MCKNQRILPSGWDAKQAGDEVLKRLVNICAPCVRGAHDSDFVILKDKAYIIYMANDIQPSENPAWPFVYVALSIVDLRSMAVEEIIPVAASEMAYENEVLPVGACFVPRIIPKGETRLRCFFASENPGVREGQTWYIDFDMEQRTFDRNIYRAKLKTDQGEFNMQPQHFYQYAVSRGFEGEQRDYGLYPIDSFKKIGRQTYAVLNNFPIGQNALAVLNEEMDTFEILGDYTKPNGMKLSESSVNRLPDGSWLAISRQDSGNWNYTFSRSADGRHWTVNEFYDWVPNGSNSKPTFDLFNGIYYLGWQEDTKIDGVPRSVFNLDVSTDGVHWERKYRFESVKSFQYPTFRQYKGMVYLTVTQGDTSEDRKERIMFGILE